MADLTSLVRGLWGRYAEKTSPRDMRRLEKKLPEMKAEVDRFDPELWKIYQRAFGNQIESETGVVASHRRRQEIGV